jgi:hypothetical protein
MEPVIRVGNECRARRPWRRLCAAAFLAIAALAVAAWREQFKPATEVPNVMLIYVGAEDCAPCRAWQRNERTAFLDSADFARITYREVKSPHLEDVLKDEYWPAELRDYRGRLKRSDGVPLWLVVADHAIVEQQFGMTAWQQSILPKLRFYLR